MHNQTELVVNNNSLNLIATVIFNRSSRLVMWPNQVCTELVHWHESIYGHRALTINWIAWLINSLTMVHLPTIASPIVNSRFWAKAKWTAMTNKHTERVCAGSYHRFVPIFWPFPVPQVKAYGGWSISCLPTLLSWSVNRKKTRNHQA